MLPAQFLLVMEIFFHHGSVQDGALHCRTCLEMLAMCKRNCISAEECWFGFFVSLPSLSSKTQLSLSTAACLGTLMLFKESWCRFVVFTYFLWTSKIFCLLGNTLPPNPIFSSPSSIRGILLRNTEGKKLESSLMSAGLIWEQTNHSIRNWCGMTA